MMNLIAIQERFDARAAAALEMLIEEVEASGEVRAVALDVVLVPDRECGPRGQTVAVNLKLEGKACRHAGGASERRGPGGNDR